MPVGQRENGKKRPGDLKPNPEVDVRWIFQGRKITKTDQEKRQIKKNQLHYVKA